MGREKLFIFTALIIGLALLPGANYRSDAEKKNQHYDEEVRARTLPELFYTITRGKSEEPLFFTEHVNDEPLESRGWELVFDEDFEDGTIPPGWEVFDGNYDGNTWHVGQTPVLREFQPPNYGNTYACYVDNEGTSRDFLISPQIPLDSASRAKFSYSVGYREGDDEIAITECLYNDYRTVFDEYYCDDEAKVEEIELPLDISANSLSLEFRYFERRSEREEYAWGIDNVKVWLLPQVDHDAALSAEGASKEEKPVGKARKITGTIQNPGRNSESNIGVHVRVTNGEKAVLFSEDTTIVNLNVGDTLQINFGYWTPTEPGEYTVTIYTDMAGDEEALNDTLCSTFTVYEWAWQRIADLPDSVYMHATVYEPGDGKNGDKIYVIGGGKGPYGALNTCYRYDPVTDTWDIMSPMPTARKWIQGAYCNSKIYVMGGFDGSNVLDVTEIYDCAGNSWGTGQSLPNTRYAHGLVAWRDSLIYLIGGNQTTYLSTNTVYYYDPDVDSWLTATSLPDNFYMGGATIYGDKIYIFGGFPGPYTNVVVGTINPSDPGDITWEETDELRIPNGNNAACAMQGKFYIVGGYENGTDNTEKCWEYDPAGKGGFYPLPDYPFEIARDNYLVSRPDSTELYCMGGDEWGIWQGTSLCYKLVHGDIPETDTDVRVTSIQSPLNVVGYNTPVTPVARVKNIGTSTVSFNVTCEIDDSTGSNEYNNTQNVSNLAPNSMDTIDFASWTPQMWGMTYTVTVYTELVGDEWPYNDTLSKNSICFSPTRTILSGWTDTPPVIDGLIGTKGEWTNAGVYDVSDFLGYSDDNPDPLGSAYLYVMNDLGNLYLALDYIIDDTLDGAPTFAVSIDEDNNDDWATDSSEGSYGIAPPYMSYWSLPSWWEIPGPPGIDYAWGSWNVVYEFNIPFGTEKYELTAGPGDTMGFFCWARDDWMVLGGWWPQDITGWQADYPYYFGNLVLASLTGIGESEDPLLPIHFELSKCFPNPALREVTINYAIPELSHTAVKVYDISGRVVRTLIDETLKPAYHSITWDGKDNYGKILPSGVYFIRLEAGEYNATRKITIMR